MSIKSILCIFDGAEGELSALDAAMLLAEIHMAKLRVLHISPEPSAYVGLYGEGFIENSRIIEAIEKENKDKLEKAKQHVISFASRHCLNLNGQSKIVANNKVNDISAEFVHLTGDKNSIIANQGRICDVIVMGRGTSEPNTFDDYAIVTALFETGRPILLMPFGKSETPAKWQAKTVALAWNGGLEAARAIYNSLPFLERAEKIQLLTARERGEVSDLEAEEHVIEYLQCHGLHVTGIIVAAGNRTPAEALLMRAKELETDLLVMGVYGHSRFREMILGGVTNHVLKTSDIPLLLSH